MTHPSLAATWAGSVDELGGALLADPAERPATRRARDAGGMGMKLKMNQLNLKLTPGDACAKLKANDPSMHTCDLSNNAVMQARASHRSSVSA